jgi:predicted GNAT family acetyltransferase
MAGRIRILGAADRDALEQFLERHADSSMFLRANSRNGGLVDQGERYQGTYAAAIEGDRIAAVAAHWWNGLVTVQTPVAGPEVVRAAVRASGRAVSGINGPWAHAVVAREALDLAAAPMRSESREVLYALGLDDLLVPETLASGRVRCRRPDASDMSMLATWRATYRVELEGHPDGPELRAAARQDVESLNAESRDFVLVDGDDSRRLLAYSAFNAVLSDVVQVGGVFTPADLRRRGYARAVVAGSLIVARARAVERAILFTGEVNVAARRAYETIGFRRVGDYGLLGFAEPHLIP